MSRKVKYLHEVIKLEDWRGKSCFLIGGGPSLTNFPPEKLDGRLTIGINKAFIKYNPTINYSMDIKFYDLVAFSKNGDINAKKLSELWGRYRGVKVFLDLNPNFPFTEDIYVVRNIPRMELSLDLSRGISPGDNSGFGALMIACSLGCNPIFLLGYDMSVSSEKTHWHEGYGRTPGVMGRKLNRYNITFEDFAPRIRDAGIEVMNLNPNSNLRCFPMRDSKEVL